MALLGKLFYKKPPDGLLEISERVYVFDCCFTIDPWDHDNYRGYIGNIVSHLKDHYPEASILIFNFREGDTTSQLASALSDHDMTIVEYPRHYEGCPILSMEAIHHFLRSCESWLSFGMQNVLLMHCERGGWPVLAFMLAALLIYRKQYSGESKTLDMVYKQAPTEVVHLFSSLNPLPSQLRYLQYVSRRNVATEWPPLDRALSLDCVIMRMIPDVDGNGGCRPIFRIYGQDPYMPGDKSTKLLFSTPKWSKNVRYYKQAECEVVIIDVNCHIQGDIVLECINYLIDDDEVEHENIMYRAMFNTSFIRSNILIVNRDEIDILWDANYEFPKDFKAEFLFSEMDAAASIVTFDAYFFDEKDTIPIEAFSKVQEIFSSVDWPSPTRDAAIDKGKKRTVSSENDPKASSQLAKEKPFVSQEPLDASRRSVSSSTSTSPKYLSESEPVHPYLRGQQETHLHESTTSSKNLAAGVDKSPSAKSNQLLKENTDNEPLSQTRPPTQPAFPPSIQPSPSFKDLEVKVEPSLTVPSHKSPSRSSREDRSAAAQTSHTPRRSQDSPPLSPPTPPLKEKLATGSEPTPPRTPPRSTSPSPKKSTDKPGPSPSSPPPTETKKEKLAATARTSPTPPVSPPHATAPTKEKPERTVRPSPTPPVSPPPATASTKEKPERTAGPSLMPPVSPPPSTPATKEKPERTAGPSSLPPVSPPPSTAPTKEKPERTAGPSPMPPLSPPPSTAPTKERSEMVTTQSYTPAPPPAPLPPPPPTISLKEIPKVAPPPPPPPTPPPAGPGKNNGVASPVPPPPPPIPSNQKGGVVPPPPPPSRATSLPGAPAPPPPLGRGRGLSLAMKNQQGKKLKPLHWLKLTRAVQGSLWAETQKSGEAVKTPEIDIKELENLFSAANPNQDKGGPKSKSASVANKPEKVQLIEHRRACNCEIMLSKVKIPLNELMDYVLALDESALDVDQVDNLIKFCPTKEEIDLLKSYKGEKDKLGKCEQFFMELMKVPRTESKLRVFSFKLQFGSQVSDLRKSLNSVNSAVEEVRSSSKFKRVMQTILTLGNALNQGTARGSAVGFRLDSLLKLTDTRARNNKMTLMHYLCKVLSEKLPELLDFSKELESLEPASKVQLKYLAEEMQSISKGLEKVVQELSTAENDGPVSEKFIKALKEFLCSAEGEARALASLYSLVGKNVDALILYFGEDPARCPYEHVVSTLRNFVRMFNQAHEENCKKLEAEIKKAEKDASNELSKPCDSKMESEKIKNSPIKTVK
uniref:formin-like protein 13 n=1 Tax=Erigeron canadensis TaxID=72917 RepID=UPI001CB9D472|nr:formin-like protein 13 [Erigeron canadensis]